MLPLFRTISLLFVDDSSLLSLEVEFIADVLKLLRGESLDLETNARRRGHRIIDALDYLSCKKDACG
jgi:hypothetical protein